MSDSPTLPAGYRFGTFEVDLPAATLRRAGLEVRLRGRPFDILVLLLETPGEVVTREQLKQRLWTEDSVSYEGPGCRLDKVHMNIRPVQKPRPPIWMAANGDAAVKRAARMSDAWLINPHAGLTTLQGSAPDPGLLLFGDRP